MSDNIEDMDYNDILNKINEFLPIRKKEKDKYGEVFTPTSVIEEMLDHIPKDVWSNPDLKWLDPANGIGNFPMVVYFRLMKGLEKAIPDKEKRKHHIVDNMLYMVELNVKNIAISKKIFGQNANIYCGSFLSPDKKNVNSEIIKTFKIDKFDIILGNPPFNQEALNKIGSAGRSTLWDNFIVSSLTILKQNGYLGFINPANWRGPENKLWDIMNNLQILYLHIYSKKDGMTYFKVGSRFDLYVLQNKNNTKPTLVIDELNKTKFLKLNELPFLANYNYDIINKILTTKTKGIDVMYSSSLYDMRRPNMSKEKTKEFKYPIVHSINKEGIILTYSNTNEKGHFKIPKVILNFNENQYSHKEQNDYLGKYGMSQISFGIPIKDKHEGDMILQAIETPEFKELIKATKWGTFQTDWRMFQYFKKDWYKLINN